MSRVIKFRAWIRDDWEFEGPGEFKMISGDTLAFEEYRPLVDHLEDVEGYKYLMQFTGLHDKNGKEIYEGDIIRLIDDVGEEVIVECRFGTWSREIYGQTLNLCDITGFAFIKDGKATFPIVNNYAGKHDLELFEIIGNIYQNPELIQQ